MKKPLLILITAFLCIFVSCDKEEDNDTNGLENNDTEINYVFKDISYCIEEGDGVLSIEKDSIFPITFRNNTSDTSEFTCRPFSGLRSRSYFKLSQSLDKNIKIPDSIKVLYPSLSNVFSYNYIVLSNDTVLHEFPGSYSQESNLFSTEVGTNVPPYCSTKIQGEYSVEKLRYSFSAIFVDENSQKELTIKGKWHGVKYTSPCTVRASGIGD